MADGYVLIDAKINESPFRKGLDALGGMVTNSGLSKALGGVMAGITAASGALTAAGGFAIKTGMEFDSSMAQVAATMGLTVDQIGAMRDAAIEYGASTAFSATEAAQALNYLALAGYDAEKAVDVLPAVLNLAAAGSMDLAYASDLVTDAMAALGVAATEANVTGFGDAMAMTASKANTSVAQLGEAILTVGGTATSLSGGVTELNTALGVLANRGIKGAEGGTHLRNIILSLSAPTDTAAEAISELGVQITDSAGAMRPLNEVMADFNAATEGMSETARMQYLRRIFNLTDLAAVQGLLAGCGDEWEALEGHIANADGAMSAMAETQLDNLAGDVENLSGALESLGIAAYDQIEGPLRELTQLGASMVEELTSALTEGGFDAFAAKLGDVLATAVSELASRLPELAKMGASLIKSLVSGLKKNAPQLAKAAVEVFKTLATGLADILPDLLMAAADLFEELASNMPELLAAVWEAIKSIDWINLGKSILESILNGLGSIAQGIVGLFADSIPLINEIDWSSLGTNIMNGLGDIGGWFADLFGDGLSLAEGLDWSSLGSAIISGLSNLGQMLSGIFTAAKEEVAKISWADVGESLMGSIRGALDTTGAFLSAGFAAGKAAIEAIDWVSLGNTIGSAFNGIVDVSGAFLSGGFTAAEATIKAIDWESIGTTIGDAFNGLVDTSGDFLSAGFTAAQAAIEAIDWQNTGQTIGESFEGLVDTTGKFLSEGFTAAQSAIEAIDWKDLGQTIGESFNGLVDTTGEFLSAGFVAAQAAIEEIDWEALGETIADAFDNLVDTTGAFLSGGFTAAKAAIEAIDWAGIGKMIGDAFNGIIDATGAFISGGFTAAQATIEGIDWSGIGTTIADSFNGLVDATGEFLSGGFTAAAATIRGIDWAGIGSDVASGLNSAWNIAAGLGGFGLSTAELAVDASNAGIKALRSWMGLDNQDNSEAQQVGSDIATHVGTGLTNAIPTLEESAATAATALLNALKTTLGVSENSSATTTVPLGNGVVMGIVDGIDDRATEATFTACAFAVFSASLGALESAFGASGGSAATNIKPVGNSIVEGVVEGVNERATVSTFSAAAGSTADAAKGALESSCDSGLFAYIGRMICEGIANGIDSSTGVISRAARAAANVAYAAAKRELGIASPSKRFAELGMYCAQGMASGLEDNSDDVVDAYRSIIDEAKGYIDDSGMLDVVSERMRMAVEGKTIAAVDASGLKDVLGIDYREMAHAIWEEAPEELGIEQTINFNQPVRTPDEVAREIRYNNTQGLVGAKR